MTDMRNQAMQLRNDFAMMIMKTLTYLNSCVFMIMLVYKMNDINFFITGLVSILLGQLFAFASQEFWGGNLTESKCSYKLGFIFYVLCVLFCIISVISFLGGCLSLIIK